MGFFVTCPHCGQKFEVHPGGKKRDYAKSINNLLLKLKDKNPYVYGEISNVIMPAFNEFIPSSSKDFYTVIKNISANDELMHHYTNSDLIARAKRAKKPIQYYKAAIKNTIIIYKGQSAWKE